jgi:hypothetical protein
MERDAISKLTKEAPAAAKARGVGWRCSVEGVTQQLNCPLVSAAPLIARWPVAAGPTVSLSLGFRSPADSETRLLLNGHSALNRGYQEEQVSRIPRRTRICPPRFYATS